MYQDRYVGKEKQRNREAFADRQTDLIFMLL